MLCIKCKEEISDGFAFCPHCAELIRTPKHTKRIRGNGTGSVYKRGKVWQIEITVGWKSIFRSAQGRP